MERPDTIATIDPGISNGGVALWRKGEPVKVARIPRNLTDLSKYIRYIKKLDPKVVFFIEQVNLFHSDSAPENPGMQFRIKKMLDSYAQIKAVLILNGLAFVEVYPRSWQATLKLGKNKGLTNTEKKNKFKTYAANCFPEIKVTLWSSDALCLVQFALTKYEMAPEWIAEKIQNTNGGELKFAE